MKVLEDQREAALAEIAFARLADGAGGRVGPEGFVVCAAVVVAGEAEEAGYPENEERGREGQEAWDTSEALGPNSACDELPKSSGE